MLGVLVLGAAGLYAKTTFQSDPIDVVAEEQQDGEQPPAAEEKLLGQDSQVLPAPPAPVLKAKELSAGLPTRGMWRGRPAFADFNGDGHLDLGVSIRRWSSGEPGEGLFVYIGDGQGNWELSVEGIRRDMGYGGASTADIDGNGTPDLAFSAHDTPPQTFLNQGDGTWKESSIGIFSEGVCSDTALADFDSDGFMDLAVLGSFPEQGGLFLFRGNGGESWELIQEVLPVSEYGSSLEVADVNGDGNPELLAACSAGARAWTWGDGALVDLSEGLPTRDSYPDRTKGQGGFPGYIMGSDLVVEAADIDGDGVTELLVAGMFYTGHLPLRIYRFESDKWVPWGEDLPRGEAFFDARFAQLDGEGPLEIVLAGKHGISIISMVAPGKFERAGRLMNDTQVFNVGTGDVNGDAKEDIVFIGEGGVKVFDVSDILGGVQ